MKIIRNELSPQTQAGFASLKLDNAQPSTSTASAEFYGLNLQLTKETFYKDIPSSSKNFNLENLDAKKYSKADLPPLYTDLDLLNLQSKESNKIKFRRNEFLNNGSRRYSDSSAQKSNLHSQGSVAGSSRFKTTLVTEDLLRPSTSAERQSNNNTTETPEPAVTKAKDVNVRPGFNILDAQHLPE